MKNLILILFFLVATNSSYSDTKSSVTLAADDWCPFTCDPNAQQATKGLLFDIASAALNESKFEMKYEFINWARATALMKKQKIDGLIGVYASDFPELLLTKSPLMISQDCFYSKSESTDLKNWQWNGLKSLDGLKVGIINGYGYGEIIDNFKLTAAGKKIFFESSGDNPLNQNIKKIEKNRIQLILENKMVIDYLKSQNSELKLTQHGCLEEKKIYIGFVNTPKNIEIIKKIDLFMASPQSEAKIKSILQKYLK